MKKKLIIEMRGFIPMQNEISKQMQEIFFKAQEFTDILEFWNWIVFQKDEIGDYFYPHLGFSYNSYREVTIAKRTTPFDVILAIKEEITYEKHIFDKKEISALKMIKNRFDEVEQLYNHCLSKESRDNIQLQSAENMSMQYCISVGKKTATDIYMQAIPKAKVRAYNTNKKSYL